MTVAPARRPTSASATQRSTPSKLLGAIFPGEGRVWLIAGTVLAALLVAMAVALLQPREDLLGGNSVGARSATVILPAHTPLCVPDLRVPAGTGQVRFNLSTRTELLPALEVVIRKKGGGLVKGSVPHSSIPGHRDVSIPVPRFASHPESVEADVCLISAAEVFVWGNDNLQANVPAPTLGGAPQHNRVAVWFFGPAGQQRSILSQLGEMFRRAALFRAGFVGAWTYWVLFGLVLPALAYGAIRLLANAEEPRNRRVPLPVMVATIAFGVAASWALVTPAFQSPDESEHFAYAQYFAETGRAVETVQSTRPVYSDSEGIALEAVKHDSTIELADARPPWLAADERQYRQELPAYKRQNNGGGFHPATSPHTPAYYSLLAPAYFLTRKASTFSQLLAMRLTSALMGALTAVLAMLIISELLPGRRALACAAGLLVAFAPMFGFISGAVNNDNGVNLATALMIYLVVRSLRRGLTPAVGAALGAALVVGPLLKGTAYELYPPVILGLLLAMLRKHSRRELFALGSLIATFAVFQFVWGEVSAGLHHTTFTTPGGSAPGTTLEAFHKPKTYISWLARVMLPFKPSFINHNWTIIHWPFFNIYIERGFASFGWYAIQFPKWVYVVIVAVVGGLAILGLLAVWQRRRAIVRFLPELVFLLAVPIVVICAVEAAFEPSLANLPIEGTAEQGRYVFPAITAVAALAIGACFALGRRRALSLATALVAGLVGMTVASELLTLSAFYT